VLRSSVNKVVDVCVHECDWLCDRECSGHQAVVLNKVVDELEDDHPAKMNDRKLKEVLGHTPRQVWPWPPLNKRSWPYPLEGMCAHTKEGPVTP
jgi:hypothetical protein